LIDVNYTLVNIVAGIIFSLLIAGSGYKRGNLSKSGLIGALIVGTIIFGFGGWIWFTLLIAFFISSSMLTKYKFKAKERLAEKFAKGGRRDFWQAIANAGVGSIVAILLFYYMLTGGMEFKFEIFYTSIFTAAFIGAMSTVTADTWATEIGVLSKEWPRMITNWKKVPPGTSGGVSRLGTLCSFAATLFIAFAAILCIEVDAIFHIGKLYYGILWILPASIIGGFIGSLADSIMGATVQAIYYCDKCKKETERKIHLCGEKTRQIRGISWFSNDLVNFLSSLVGAIVASLIYILLV